MNGDLTLEDLYAAANEMCRRHWGVDYSGEIELVNRKWRSINAYITHERVDVYDYRDGKDGEHREDYAHTIRFSRKENTLRTRDAVLGTLLHELVHWRLFCAGVPHRDTDTAFVAECLRIGAPLSRAKSAQAAYKTYLAKLGYEQRTGTPYDEGVTLIDRAL